MTRVALHIMLTGFQSQIVKVYVPNTEIFDSANIVFMLIRTSERPMADRHRATG